MNRNICEFRRLCLKFDVLVNSFVVARWKKSCVPLAGFETLPEVYSYYRGKESAVTMPGFGAGTVKKILLPIPSRHTSRNHRHIRQARHTECLDVAFF